MKLQRAIDLVQIWATQHGLQLNASKTVHIHFSRKRHPKVTQYYVEAERIRKKTFIRDLGVIIDDKLYYKQHVEEIKRRSNCALAVILRFCREMHLRNLAISLHGTYIAPLTDYCAHVWANRLTQKQIKELERPLRIFSRFTLGTDFNPNESNYISHDERFALLDEISTAERRQIQQILTMLRLQCRKQQSIFDNEITRATRITGLDRRNVYLYKWERIFSRDSPFTFAMRAVNNFLPLIDDEFYLDTVGKKIKLHFITAKNDTYKEQWEHILNKIL